MNSTVPEGNGTTPTPFFPKRANCSIAPPSTFSDAGISGPGIILSFIITSGVSLLLSAFIIYRDRSHPRTSVCRRLLLSYADKEILTGIGIQIVALFKIHTLVPYHVWLVWMLGVLSTVTHLSTLLAIANDLKRDWILRWVRQGLMFINMGLSWALGIFMLKAVIGRLPPTLPISCVFEDFPAVAKDPAADDPFAQYIDKQPVLSIVGTIGVIAGNLIVFLFGVWYLHFRRASNLKWMNAFKAGGLVLTAAIMVIVTARVIQVSQSFGEKPGAPLSDQGEKQWSFGQVLALLVLLTPLISVVEIWRGDVKVPPPDDNDGPYDELDKHKSFQPNPIWGRSRFST